MKAKNSGFLSLAIRRPIEGILMPPILLPLVQVDLLPPGIAQWFAPFVTLLFTLAFLSRISIPNSESCSACLSLPSITGFSGSISPLRHASRLFSRFCCLPLLVIVHHVATFSRLLPCLPHSVPSFLTSSGYHLMHGHFTSPSS